MYIFISQFGVFSQACGSGIFRFEIKTETNTEEITYEILQIKKSSTDHNQDYYYGVLLDEKQLKNFEFENFNINNLPPILRNTVYTDYDSTNRVIKFTTIEGLNRNYVLKIKVNKRTIYVLSNFFGGCDRKTTLIISKKQYLVKSRT
ncbi:hypothetical protein [Tenacibaculum jejuense]|nr:hypothetical protein [Tenacibaculum jejuense]